MDCYHEERHLPWCPKAPCRCKTDAYLIALCATLSLTVIEGWGSYESRSFSLFGDFWHVLSDFAVYFVAWHAARLKTVMPWERTELDNKWGTINSYILLGVALMLVVAGGWRFFSPIEIKGGVLVFLGMASLLVNVAIGGLLWFVGNGHGHTHNHDEEDKTHEIAFWHTAGDALSSFVVLMVGALPFLDYAGSVAIGLILFLVARKNLREISERKKAYRHT